jgi:AmiR/NasT family two-component response regulator
MTRGASDVTRSVLLVDEDSEHRTRMAQSLNAAGVSVTAEAASPEEAMRAAATAAPDVALLTAALGNGAGMRLADRLSGEHGVPVILLAPRAASATMTLAAQPGVMGLLVEPVAPAALRATLEVAVCRHQEILALRKEAEALRRTIEERKIIEQAKGLLMELGRLPERDAYARIRQKSMDTQRPMVEIARAIILAAELNEVSGHPSPRH